MMVTNARARAVELYLDGLSTTAVGHRLGLSRESVRKYLLEAGVQMRHFGGVRSADPVAVMRAVRSPGVETYLDAARVADCAPPVVSRVVASLKCEAAVARLFRWRKRARMIDALQEAARQLARTPSANDMQARLCGLATMGAYMRMFGTIRKAQAAAGLPPAAQGLPAHGVRGD